MKNIVIFLGATLCATPALAQDSWTITTPEGGPYTEASDRAKNRYATDELWEFSARDFLVRLNPGFEDGTNETAEFRSNNTIFTLPLTIDGNTVRVACDTDPEAPGTAIRTELTDERVSGRFEMNITSCSDYATGAPLEYEGLPFQITGEFSVELK